MNTLKDFRLNDRVQTHPATDTWMRGDRYGTVVRVGSKYVQVHLDRSNTRKLFAPSNLLHVNGNS